METLIALVLSSFIIALVSHTFLVQNRFYATQTVRTGVQDNVRGATELMAREIRSTAEDGIVVAGARTLTIRSPLAVFVICNRSGGNDADIMTDGGEGVLDTGEVGGLALRNDSTWEYYNATWAAMDDNNTNAAADCEANGADTVGASGQFHRIDGLGSIFPSVPSEGDILMMFRETTFSIRQSQLDSTTFALYRAPYGQAAVEFATGIDTTAQFQYRTGGSTYADTIPTAVGSIDAVRIVADARKRAPTGGVSDITFGWAVNIPLRNIR